MDLLQLESCQRSDLSCDSVYGLVKAVRDRVLNVVQCSVLL